MILQANTNGSIWFPSVTTAVENPEKENGWRRRTPRANKTKTSSQHLSILSNNFSLFFSLYSTRACLNSKLLEGQDKDFMTLEHPPDHAWPCPPGVGPSRPTLPLESAVRAYKELKHTEAHTFVTLESQFISLPGGWESDSQSVSYPCRPGRNGMAQVRVCGAYKGEGL